MFLIVISFHAFKCSKNRETGWIPLQTWHLKFQFDALKKYTFSNKTNLRQITFLAISWMLLSSRYLKLNQLSDCDVKRTLTAPMDRLLGATQLNQFLNRSTLLYELAGKTDNDILTGSAQNVRDVVLQVHWSFQLEYFGKLGCAGRWSGKGQLWSSISANSTATGLRSDTLDRRQWLYLMHQITESQPKN